MKRQRQPQQSKGYCSKKYVAEEKHKLKPIIKYKRQKHTGDKLCLE
jgi:hypothetical protein